MLSIRKPGHSSMTTRLPLPSSTRDTTPATEGVPAATGSRNTPRFSRKAFVMAPGRSCPRKGLQRGDFPLGRPRGLAHACEQVAGPAVRRRGLGGPGSAVSGEAARRPLETQKTLGVSGPWHARQPGRGLDARGTANSSVDDSRVLCAGRRQCGSLAPASLRLHDFARGWSLVPTLPSLRWAALVLALKLKPLPLPWRRLPVVQRGRQRPGAKRKNGGWPPKPDAAGCAALSGRWRQYATVTGSRLAPYCYCGLSRRWRHAVHRGITGQRGSRRGWQSGARPCPRWPAPRLARPERHVGC